MQDKNRYVEAFKEHFNVIGLATAAATSLALLATPFFPLPLLVGLVAEVAFLVFVPDSRWYEVRLAKKYDAEVEHRRAQLKADVLPTLSPEMRDRFICLEEMRGLINSQAADGQTWFREVLRKLDFLLEKFLQFAAKEVQFRLYLRSILEQERSGGRRGWHPEESVRRRGSGDAVQRAGAARMPAPPPDRVPTNPTEIWVHQTVGEIQTRYDKELTEIRQQREEEQDASTQAVLDKRMDVLQRRREFVSKIGRILMNLNHQLELLEDTFGLISDEIRARSPEQVLADIDEVVTQTNTMTQLLDEMAPYESTLGRI